VEAALLSGRAAPGAVQDLLFSISSKFTVAHRLLRNNGFDHVIHAENILDKYFKIFFIHNEEHNARLGIIASKKTLPSAADRNCVKRIIRETFRQHNIKAHSMDLVVMVRSAHPQESNAQLKSLEMLFSRIENRCAKQ
jgi:ribonuclease P protein component